MEERYGLIASSKDFTLKSFGIITLTKSTLIMVIGIIIPEMIRVKNPAVILHLRLQNLDVKV